MRALICALISGILFYLAHGIDNFWPLAWIAPAPLLWLAYGATPRRQVMGAAIFAYAMGMVYLFQVYGSYLIVDGTIILVSNGLLLGLTLCMARSIWLNLPTAVAIFAFPAFWTSIEYLESLISIHGAWGAMGYTQVDWPAAIQLASITGVHGITFVLCLFASAITALFRSKIVAGAIGIGITLAVVAGGYIRLASPDTPKLRVAALANVVKDDRSKEDPMTVAHTYATAILAGSARGVQVFVTPETGVESNALASIAAAAAETRSLVVVGTAAHDPQRNMATTFKPGSVPLIYHKRHLLLPGEAKTQRGSRSGFLGDGMATAICKDLDFPRTIRADAQSNIQLMIVPAWDFDLDGWMHARQAIMRGVENGFSVLRAAFQGMATISDDRGRLLAHAKIDRPGFISVEYNIPLGSGSTFYNRFGDVFVWLSLLASFCLMIFSLLRQRRIRALTESAT